MAHVCRVPWVLQLSHVALYPKCTVMEPLTLLRCKLHSPHKEKVIAQIFSQLSYFISLVLAYCSPFPRVTSAFIGPSLALFDIVLVQDFLLHDLGQNFFPHRSISLWFRLLHLLISSVSSFTAKLNLSFISSIDHPGTFFFF